MGNVHQIQSTGAGDVKGYAVWKRVMKAVVKTAQKSLRE